MARASKLGALIFAFLLVPLLAFAAEPGPRLLALAYHNVEDADPDQSFLGVTAERLIEQFSWLKANGYTPVTVDAIVAANAGGPPLPERAVLLAFDDGYESFYTRVLPILQAFDYPAVLALVGAWLEGEPTDRIGSPGRRRVVLGRGEGQVQFGDKRIARSQFLTWDEVRAIKASGLVEIASHSFDLHRGTVAGPQGLSEPDITTKSFNLATDLYETDNKQRSDINADLGRMARRILAETGTAPRVMVWPYGEHSGISIEVAAANGMPIALTLVDGSATVAKLSAVSRHLVAPDPPLGRFVQEIVQLDKVPPVRVVHVDLDYVYDPDPVQQARNLDLLIQRIYDMQIGVVFLQAFADPEGTGLAREVYFPNRVLPMRADLFDRVSWQLRTRARVQVYAWMPMLAYDFSGTTAAILAFDPATGKAGVDVKAYRRVSPFDAQARAKIMMLYEDLAAYSPFEGLLYHDDGVMSDFEDAGPAALAAYAKAGFPASIAAIRADPVLFKRWTRFKTDALIELTDSLTATVRHHRMPLLTARSIFAGPVLDPAAEAWFAQDLDRFLASYDYAAVMAMPQLENVPVADAEPWLAALVAAVARHPEGLKRTIFELQAVDWRKRGGTEDPRIPTAVLARQMRELTGAGALNFGYYPDDFVADHPDIRVLHRDFSLQSYPFLK
ncbi:MAG: poly-beta-1,6-N-acetyl-D-glucosamine N-deacetylase PgaB [Telmatospirillum sp.]|nr:poly-beta-1,6-N-acetyl-D-glucosamine N-deacetylase PgaB [Telmatospirillum sp.]